MISYIEYRTGGNCSCPDCYLDRSVGAMLAPITVITGSDYPGMNIFVTRINRMMNTVLMRRRLSDHVLETAPEAGHFRDILDCYTVADVWTKFGDSFRIIVDDIYNDQDRREWVEDGNLSIIPYPMPWRNDYPKHEVADHLQWLARNTSTFACPDTYPKSSLPALSIIFREAIPGAVCYLHEPERGVHHSRIDLVVERMRDAAKRGVQFIVHTSSPYFIDSFTKDEILIFSAHTRSVFYMSEIESIDKLLVHFAPGELLGSVPDGDFKVVGRGDRQPDLLTSVERKIMEADL